MARKKTRILLLAAATRAIVLAGILVSDAGFDDLDSSSRLQNRPCDRDCVAGLDCALDGGLPSTMFDDVAAWDSVFFVRIAKCGYETDMIQAFFPGFPLAMRVGAVILAPLRQVMPMESVYALSGLLMNIAFFAGAALALWMLSVQVLGDERWADVATLFFCVNPASVFYSAAYTESMFAACTFTGMLLLPTWYWAAVGAFTVASTARSNGILACWFLMHTALNDSWKQRRSLSASLSRCLGGCLAIIGPYAFLQLRAYHNFCVPAGEEEARPTPPWCHALLPSLYGYVQKQYWDVGFLHFYHKLERWPKVLQSVPVGALSFAGCWTWASSDWSRALTLGMLRDGPTRPLSPLARGGSGPLPRITRGSRRTTPPPVLAGLAPPGYGFGHSATTWPPPDAPALTPFIYHWALMTAVAATSMHVNVATRFLSTCPPLYWYAAFRIRKGGAPAVAIWGWALAFTVVGTLLLPNFYPWT